MLSALRLWFALSILALSTAAFADTLVVGGTVTGATLTIQDTTIGQVTAYIDPYHGTLDGQSVFLFCVDPNHFDNSNPNGYAVTISPDGVGSSTLQALNVAKAGVAPQTGGISGAAIAAGFSNANVSQLYGGLAWLSEQLENSNNTLTQQELQAAIWQLGDYTNSFSVVNPPAGFSNSAVISFEDQAEANALSSGFEVVTDSSEVANKLSAGQEYIVLTPEPSSVLLSLSGLFGVFAFRRRRSIIAS